jgi:hypothetical protein
LVGVSRENIAFANLLLNNTTVLVSGHVMLPEHTEMNGDRGEMNDAAGD